MIQVFIAVIFVAELIIASSLIFNIYKLDTKVLALNDSVLKLQGRIKKKFRYSKFLLRIIKNKIFKLKAYINRKNEEYLLKILKTTLIYGTLFSLKGKYKKVFLSFQILKEIFEGIQEA